MPEPMIALGLAQLPQWRRERGLSVSMLADELGVSKRTLRHWEASLSCPRPYLRHRILEMMREDGHADLAMTKMMIERATSMAALFDFADLRMICASRGMAAVWPIVDRTNGTAFPPLVAHETARLIFDRALVQGVRQGRVVGLGGVTDRHGSVNTKPLVRHRWTASFKTYGQRLIAELSYEPCDGDEATGLRSLVTFGEITRQHPPKELINRAFGQPCPPLTR